MLKIIKAWKRHSKIYVQLGTGRKGESSNFQFLNNKLYKTWQNIENPNSEFDYENYGITLNALKSVLKGLI